jgi:hypothetical protein
VLSQDIFKVSADALPDTTSVLTIVDGKIAYDGGAINTHKDKPVISPAALGMGPGV